MSGQIYLISKDGQPKYVGFTTQSIEERWIKHISAAMAKSNSVLHKAIRKYGKDAFTIELVADYINEDFALNVCEEFWIRHLNTHIDNAGYNMTYGGDLPPSGKGKKHPPRSDECRKKLSLAARGKSPSLETRQKLSEALKGRKVSQETRHKLSIAAKNRKRKANEN